ncbi:hypothetical protein GCM10010300_79060 [Streptomyces olivaceoviridis]|nr:hypothetical protein GCM10010300_79060 [Streptomyces olivaceoviridis]
MGAGDWLWVRPGQVLHFPDGPGHADDTVLVLPTGFPSIATDALIRDGEHIAYRQLLFAGFTGGPPRPLREPACMPAGVPWWRRLRQVLPCRSGARSCCWYDGGDRHRVNAMAIEALGRVRTQGVDPDGITGFATAHATTAGATAWETGAPATPFNVANAIQPSRGTGYINGRSRAGHAGVRRTLHRRPAPRRRGVARPAAQAPAHDRPAPERRHRLADDAPGSRSASAEGVAVGYSAREAGPVPSSLRIWCAGRTVADPWQESAGETGTHPWRIAAVVSLRNREGEGARTQRGHGGPWCARRCSKARTCLPRTGSTTGVN